MKSKDQYGNYEDFNTNTNLSINSVYVLTSQQNFKNKIWPRSQFEKVDVLRCCINNRNEEFKRTMEIRKEEFESALKMMKLPVEIIVYILEILRGKRKIEAKISKGL